MVRSHQRQCLSRQPGDVGGQQGGCGTSVVISKDRVSWRWALTPRIKGTAPALPPGNVSPGDQVLFFNQRQKFGFECSEDDGGGAGNAVLRAALKADGLELLSWHACSACVTLGKSLSLSEP